LNVLCPNDTGRSKA